MAVQQLFNQTVYQFPFSIPFQSAVIGSSLLYVTASAWSTTPNARIGVNVALDGNVLGAVSLFANEANSHKTLVAMLFSLSIGDRATHTITCSPATPNTRCDQNDVISAVQILSNGFTWSVNGPLPTSTKVQSPLSGPAVLFFSGSAYTRKVEPLGIDVTRNSKPIALSTGFTNVPNSHVALPPIFRKVMVQYGEQEIGFNTTSPDTVTDVNDHFQLAVIY